MREVDLNDRSPTRITALLHGSTRSGKTRFAATWKRPLFLSDVTESGWTTIKHMSENDFYEPDRQPKIWGIEKIGDLNEAFTKVQPLIQKGEVSTIVVDSLTFYSDLYFNAVVAAQGTQRDSRQAYGQLNDHLRHIRIQWHGLPVNVLWLTLTKEPDEENKAGIPLIPGQQSVKFAAGCDYIFYHRSHQEGANLKFEVRTKKYGPYVAGGRDEGLLPDPISNASYALLMDYLDPVPQEQAAPAPVKPTVVTPTVIKRPVVSTGR